MLRMRFRERIAEKLTVHHGHNLYLGCLEGRSYLPSEEAL